MTSSASSNRADALRKTGYCLDRYISAVVEALSFSGVYFDLDSIRTELLSTSYWRERNRLSALTSLSDILAPLADKTSRLREANQINAMFVEARDGWRSPQDCRALLPDEMARLDHAIRHINDIEHRLRSDLRIPEMTLSQPTCFGSVQQRQSCNLRLIPDLSILDVPEGICSIFELSHRLNLTAYQDPDNRELVSSNCNPHQYDPAHPLSRCWFSWLLSSLIDETAIRPTDLIFLTHTIVSSEMQYHAESECRVSAVSLAERQMKNRAFQRATLRQAVQDATCVAQRNADHIAQLLAAKEWLYRKTLVTGGASDVLGPLFDSIEQRLKHWLQQLTSVMMKLSQWMTRWPACIEPPTTQKNSQAMAINQNRTNLATSRFAREVSALCDSLVAMHYANVSSSTVEVVPELQIWVDLAVPNQFRALDQDSHYRFAWDRCRPIHDFIAESDLPWVKTLGFDLTIRSTELFCTDNTEVLQTSSPGRTPTPLSGLRC